MNWLSETENLRESIKSLKRHHSCDWCISMNSCFEFVRRPAGQSKRNVKEINTEGKFRSKFTAQKLLFCTFAK